jgi:hypothetical protein
MIEFGKWYEVEENYNPYGFKQFFYPVIKKDKKIIVLQLWRNENNPSLSPDIKDFPIIAFEKHHELTELEKSSWEKQVLKAFRGLKEEFIKKIFE